LFIVRFCNADTDDDMFNMCTVSDADLPLDTASRLFSSGVGVTVLADSVQQMAETRLAVCRDLLVLVVTIERLSEQVVLSTRWSLISTRIRG